MTTRRTFLQAGALSLAAVPLRAAELRPAAEADQTSPEKIRDADGPHQEFKGETDIPCASDTSSLRCEKGTVRCPSGPGMGVAIDPAYVKAAKPVHSL